MMSCGKMLAAAPLLRAGGFPVVVPDELVLEPAAVVGCEELDVEEGEEVGLEEGEEAEFEEGEEAEFEEGEEAELEEWEEDDEESEPTLSEMTPPETAPGLTLLEVFLAAVA
jgi:hypothetical protein